MRLALSRRRAGVTQALDNAMKRRTGLPGRGAGRRLKVGPSLDDVAWDPRAAQCVAMVTSHSPNVKVLDLEAFSSGQVRRAGG